jgi:hypothetical protein
MAPLIGVLFILGPFNFFSLLSLCNAVLFLTTLVFPSISSSPSSVWFMLCLASSVGIFYLCGVWGFTQGNYIRKKYATVLFTFQSLMACIIYYVLLPIVKNTNGIAYIETVILLILHIWSAILTLLFLQEKMMLSAK